MITEEDVKRFLEFLKGEAVQGPHRMLMQSQAGVIMLSRKLPAYKQIIRLYCQRYDCFDQYDEWVQIAGRQYRERAKKGWETRRQNQGDEGRGGRVRPPCA